MIIRKRYTGKMRNADEDSATKEKPKKIPRKRGEREKKQKVHQLSLQSQSKHLPTEHNWIPRWPVLLPGSPLQVDKHAEQTSPRAGRQTDPPQVIANRVHKS